MFVCVCMYVRVQDVCHQYVCVVDPRNFIVMAIESSVFNTLYDFNCVGRS